MKKVIIIFLTLLASVHVAKAQDVAVKTNLLYDAFLTVNAGAEVRLAPKWTFDLSGNINAWNVNDHRWRHWLIQPEVRYWFCQEWQGHFIAAHALVGQYNFGNMDFPNLNLLGNKLGDFKHHRYEGWYGGLGVAYGYSWILSRHWNIEAEIGFGWVYSKATAYPCAKCGTPEYKDKPVHYVGPTKAAVSLIYTF